MRRKFSGRDFLKIGDAAKLLGVTEQTLRNWDRQGKLQPLRHPVNGYRMYRIADLHELVKQMDYTYTPEPVTAGLDICERDVQRDLAVDTLPAHITRYVPDEGYSDQASGADGIAPLHWSAQVATDPKHRPQMGNTPSTTVRRDWRKYPQEAHILSEDLTAYRRLTPNEIAKIQGFPDGFLSNMNLTDRQKIAALGDAVPPPLGRAIFEGVFSQKLISEPAALELCAGAGGLALGSSNAGVRHVCLIDNDTVNKKILEASDHFRDATISTDDIRAVDFTKWRGKVNLLSGGPPCQPWSQSGLRQGNKDDRDLLALMPKIVAQVCPDIFVFENVPGLRSPTHQEYLSNLLKSLSEPSTGRKYGVLAGILNAADYGVPQVRRRLFIIGLRDQPAADVYRVFDRIEALATHAQVGTESGAQRRPWRTVAEILDADPRGVHWHRWLQ